MSHIIYSENIPGSRYFTWGEALKLSSMDAYAIPSEEQKRNIIKQAAALDKIREYFGAPIIVTSWLRPEKYNAYIGGASKSKHTQGIATDFIVKGYDCAEIKEAIQKYGLYPGRGEINTTNWIHLDLAPGVWFYG